MLAGYILNLDHQMTWQNVLNNLLASDDVVAVVQVVSFFLSDCNVSTRVSVTSVCLMINVQDFIALAALA